VLNLETIFQGAIFNIDRAQVRRLHDDRAPTARSSRRLMVSRFLVMASEGPGSSRPAGVPRHSSDPVVTGGNGSSLALLGSVYLCQNPFVVLVRPVVSTWFLQTCTID